MITNVASNDSERECAAGGLLAGWSMSGKDPNTS